MPKHTYRIPRDLYNSLPKSGRPTREEVSAKLWDKSEGMCYLCRGELNRATGGVVVDHDLPRIEGTRKGAKVEFLDNYNLAHVDCNAFKRSHQTAPVSAFLSFRRALAVASGTALYSDCLPHFKLKPQKTHVTVMESKATFEFADGTSRQVDILVETNLSGTFRACFVDVPIMALHNDTECQPRTIKPNQVWLIYSDLQRNPLHEPPAVRVTEPDGPVDLLMFDGQHKTIAALLLQRSRLPVKVYLGITVEQTRHLVNSIQAKIPKLSLSALELMTKMGAEYHDQLAEYMDRVAEPSEDGFLRDMPPDQLRRARQAFESALLAAAWEESRLGSVLRDHPGRGRDSLTEKKLKDKLLRPMLSLKPMSVPFEESDEIRERERGLVVDVANVFAEQAFLPAHKKPTDLEVRAIERRRKQAAIEYCARLIRAAVAHELDIQEAECLGTAKRVPRRKVEMVVERVVSHDVWTAPFNTKEMRAVQDALSKNQNYDQAFKGVGLNFGYALGGKS